MNSFNLRSSPANEEVRSEMAMRNLNMIVLRTKFLQLHHLLFHVLPIIKLPLIFRQIVNGEAYYR